LVTWRRHPPEFTRHGPRSGEVSLLPSRPSFLLFLSLLSFQYRKVQGKAIPAQKNAKRKNRRNRSEDTSPGVSAATCKLRSLVSPRFPFATSGEMGVPFRNEPRSLRVGNPAHSAVVATPDPPSSSRTGARTIIPASSSSAPPMRPSASPAGRWARAGSMGDGGDRAKTSGSPTRRAHNKHAR